MIHMAAHNIQTKRDFVKVLQYVGEGDTVATPADYAASITDPTFIAVGKVTDLNLQPDVQHNDTDVLGNEDIIDSVKTGEAYTFTFTFEMTDTDLIKYAYEASGGTTGSIDESLTFMFSELLDGTENFTAMYGCRATSCTCSLERGVWIANMTFICKEITIPNSTSPWDGETPVHASEVSAPSLKHSGAGTDPFAWNAGAIPEGRFSTTVTRGMAIQVVNGTDKLLYCKASTRRVEFTVDAFIKSNTLETDWLAKTKRAALYSISASPNDEFSFTDCVITSFNRQKTASNADAFKESITARAESVTITTS